MRTAFCIRLVLSTTILLLLAPLTDAVDFPGPQPGPAKSSQQDGIFTLENAVISQSWRIANGTLHPAGLTNQLTSATFDQSGRELFRLGTRSAETKKTGVFVAVRLDADRTVALASADGISWTELAGFPRTEFTGEPKIVRFGKMNLKAESKDYAGEAGDVGQGIITDIDHHPPFEFKTPANHAATTEFPFPAGATYVSCRIDKGSDKGESWGPALAVIWEEGKRFLLVGVRDAKPIFNVVTADGEKILGPSLAEYPAFDVLSSNCKFVAAPKIAPIAPLRNTGRPADRIPGISLLADLVSEAGVQIHWRAELRDGSSYIRQTLQLASDKRPIPLFGVEMVDVAMPEAKTIGTCPGSPVAGAGMFLGVEIPGSRNAISPSGARVGFGCRLELSPAQSYNFGSVIGVAAEGQLRRSFLYYIERERARQSSPFLHYNCWYDLGYSVDAASLVDAARQFDKELVKRRGVPVLSYLCDDGWDDPSKGLWAENTGKFPEGFAGVKKQMDLLGSHLGIWISPLGGYGGDHERTDDARKMGIIPPDGKLDLSYPAYKKWFQDRCLKLMREDGVNAFKWDRAGDGVSPHFMALLDIAHNLHAENPNLFINVTVGTWPSPFWLNHIDSTWRNNSSDVGWAGKGDDREKWLTFRDGYCRQMFVVAGPLYPLNSVMHHGIVHGRCFQGEKVGKSGPNLKNEARSYFANGTSLQELYITPSMMTQQAWDDVAEAAKWAHENADVLADSHWVGGDPLKLEPYGYAAWSPRKGTLMIRNPDDAARSIELEVGKIFELPVDAPKHYSLASPYKDQRVQTLDLQAGQTRSVTLDPFEVLVFDGKPE